MSARPGSLLDLFANPNTMYEICKKGLHTLRCLVVYVPSESDPMYQKDRGITPYRRLSDVKSDDVYENNILNRHILLNVYVKKAEAIIQDTGSCKYLYSMRLLTLTMLYLFPKCKEEVRYKTVYQIYRLYFEVVPFDDRINIYLGGTYKKKVNGTKKKTPDEASYDIPAKDGFGIVLKELYILDHALTHSVTTDEDIKMLVYSDIYS